MQFTLYKIIREDAKQRHENHAGTIFNAPRPLMGDDRWQCDFIHGIFYTAISSSDEYARQMIEKNHAQDAYVIEYVTKAEAIKLAHDDYVERGYEDRFPEFSPADLDMLFVKKFENSLCKSTIEL